MVLNFFLGHPVYNKISLLHYITKYLFFLLLGQKQLFPNYFCQILVGETDLFSSNFAFPNKILVIKFSNLSIFQKMPDRILTNLLIEKFLELSGIFMNFLEYCRRYRNIQEFCKICKSSTGSLGASQRGIQDLWLRGYQRLQNRGRHCR